MHINELIGHRFYYENGRVHAEQLCTHYVQSILRYTVPIAIRLL